MKTTIISTFIAIALLTTGTAFAQGGQGRRGGGYGGPPQTEAERSARQGKRQQANGGVCTNNGVCDGTGKGQGAGRGQGKGQGNVKGEGQGKGQRRGPRGGGGNCQFAN